MHLAVVVNHYMPAGHGGCSIYVRYFCETMAELGHTVTVLASVKDGSETGVFEQGRLTVFKFPVSQHNPLKRYFQRRRLYYRHLERVNRARPIDWINLHSGHWLFDLDRHPVLGRIPRVYTFHASLPFELRFDRDKNRMNGIRMMLPQLLAYRLRYAVYRYTEGRMLVGAARIVVLSDFVRGQIRRFYPDVATGKIVKIPGGISAKVFTGIGKDEAKRRLGIAPGTILFFSLRRMVERMGLENMIDALSVVRDVPWECILGSDGRLRGALEQRVERLGLKERFRFAGRIPEEDIAVYFKAADAFILPTEELEGFGLVTLESLAAGTPVIATNAGATPEILNQYHPELVADGVDAAALAEVISVFIRDYEQRYRQGFAGTDDLTKKYAWQSIGRQWQDMLTGVLETEHSS